MSGTSIAALGSRLEDKYEEVEMKGLGDDTGEDVVVVFEERSLAMSTRG